MDHDNLGVSFQRLFEVWMVGASKKSFVSFIWQAMHQSGCSVLLEIDGWMVHTMDAKVFAGYRFRSRLASWMSLDVLREGRGTSRFTEGLLISRSSLSTKLTRYAKSRFHTSHLRVACRLVPSVRMFVWVALASCVCPRTCLCSSVIVNRESR
jgi:hypothetical protein